MKTQFTERIRIRDRSGNIKGPFKRDEVLDLIRQKKLDGEEEIFLESEGKWKPIASDTQFFDLIQETVFGIRSGTQSRSVEKPDFSGSFDKDQYPKMDRTEKLPTQHKSVVTGPTQVKAITKITSAPLDIASPEKIKEPYVHTPPEVPNVISSVRPSPAPQEEIRGFEDLAGVEKKPKRFKGAGFFLFIILIAGAALYLLPENIEKPDFSNLRLEFNYKKGYFRPLLLRLRLLSKLDLPPQKLENDIDQVKVLPLNVHDLMLMIDEKDREKDSQQNLSTWIYKSWTYRILGDAIAAADLNKGKEFKAVSDAIYSELLAQKLVNDEFKTLFKSLDHLLGGEIGKSFEDLKELKESSLAADIFKRELSYWATLGGIENTDVKTLSFNELSDLALKYQYEEELRQKAGKSGFSDDFLKSAENLLTQDAHSLVAWLLLSKYYTQQFKGNPSVPNRYYFTGLCQLSLWPRTLQSMYWRLYAQFLGETGSKDAAAINASAELIEKGTFESDPSAIDLDNTLFRFNSLLETYKKAFEQNEMSPVELASFEILSEASSSVKENMISVLLAPLLDKNWVVADRRLRLVEKTFPFDADVKTLRIWLEGERFRFENAQKILEESFSMSGSNSPDVVRAEGVMYVLGRDYERGTGALKKYLEFNAQDGIALFFLGRAAFESEKYTECVRFSKLSQLNSVGPLKLRAQTMMYRCRVLAQLGVDDALTEFGNFVSRFPRTSISREEYIRAMVDADRSQEAMKMAEQDVVDNPQSSSLKILLGDIYQKRGASNEALALFNEARKIDPRNARAALHIGDLFFKEERYKEAAQNYVDAAAQDPELPELYLKAARAYHLAGNFNEAEEMYFQEIKMRPAVLDTFLEAAEFLLESNRPAKVPDLFQEYGENFKSDPRVLTRLAQAYFAIGDSKNARVNAEIAVRLNPTEAEPYRILGSIFETQGQYPLAKSNYEKYILLVPQAPEVGDLKRKLALPPYVNE